MRGMKVQFKALPRSDHITCMLLIDSIFQILFPGVMLYRFSFPDFAASAFQSWLNFVNFVKPAAWSTKA
jgi:hypothetical protein